ncbi:MAG TPA: efflux RND transporter permease subunit, partial [Neisseria sp.]|nr:efflux RND transporter permease subunit [Neisseria sp.]
KVAGKKIEEVKLVTSGAGAAGRIAIGTAVLGGTIISTLLGLLFVPLFFVWVRGWVARRKTV